MIYQLMRRDTAWRVAPFLALACAAVLPLLGPNLLAIALVLFANVWGALLIVTKPYERCDLFSATLPIPAQDLLLVRLLSLLSVVWLPVVTGVIVLPLRGNTGIAGGLVEYGATMTLAVIINFAVREREFEAPRWVSFVLWACVVILTGVRAAWPNAISRELMSGIFLLASLLLYVRIRATLPASFQIRDQAMDEAVPRPERLVFVWKPVVSSMFSWRILVLLIQPAFFAWTFGWLFAAIQIPAGPTQLMTELRWTWTLPLSRHQLLRICLLPLVVLVSVIYMAVWASSAFYQPSNEVRISTTRGPALVVSTSYWKVAPGSRVPEIRAPWNESACAVETKRVLGITLYNPWSATSCNTPQFLRWQQQRANLAIYGSQSPFSKAIPVTRQPAMLLVSAGLMLILGMTALFLIHAKRWMRVSEGARKLLFGCGAALAVLVIVSILIPLFMNAKNMLSESALFQLSLLFPGNAWIVSIATLALLAAAYWALERQFEDVELFTPPATDSKRVSLFGGN